MVDDLSRKVDRIEVALLVRDPGTSMAAEAYEGLRRQVGAAAQQRRQHLVQLAMMDQALGRTSDPKVLHDLVHEWMNQAGLMRVDEPEHKDLFRVIAGKGDGLEVLSPAYVDGATGALIQEGQAKAVGLEASLEPETSPEESGEDGGEQK
jgi:hypothetical protein